MILPEKGDVLKVDDRWVADENCPDELLLVDKHGRTWSVSVMAFNYLHSLTMVNKTFGETDAERESQAERILSMASDEHAHAKKPA